MGAPSAGEVVLVPFPFSNLTRAKLRPAVVLALAARDDVVLCQVTSNPYGDPTAVELRISDFARGSLRRSSFVRPGKLFTASGSLLLSEVGALRDSARIRVVEAVVGILRGDAVHGS